MASEDTPLLSLVDSVVGADPSVPSVAVQVYALPEIVVDDYGARQFKVPDATVESMLELLDKYAANHSKYYLKGEARWEHDGSPRYKMEVWGPWDVASDTQVWLDAKMGQRQGKTRTLDGGGSYRHDGGSAGIYMDPDAVLTVMTGAEVVGMYTPQLAALVNTRVSQDAKRITAQALRLTDADRAVKSLTGQMLQLQDEVEDLEAELRG